MPASEKFLVPKALVGIKGEFIEIGYVPVVERAIEIMRKGWGRADAVEMAFDSLLAAGNGRKWTREGEVILMRHKGIARALCVGKE